MSKEDELNKILDNLNEFEKSRPKIKVDIEEIEKELNLFDIKLEAELKRLNLKKISRPKFKAIKVRRCDSE